ncbi:MAG: heme biosynthesis HemY N-terminal domain-containing protein [Thiogranum sp.]
MKWLMFALLALIASVTVALVALPDPGYVLIGFGTYSVETSLLVFLIVLGVAYVALRILAGLWHVPAKVNSWEHRRHDRRLHSLFDEAIVELAEGRVERAERRLARLLKSPQAPVQAYLSAARAASQLGLDDRRDQYLKLARQRHPAAQKAVAITQAELQLSESQLDQAQTTLARLQTLAPRSEQTLRLLMKLYLQQQDWERLRDLLPVLRRAKLLSGNQWQQLVVKVYREQVLALASVNDVSSLNTGWKQLPQVVQQDEGLMTMYIQQLMRLGAYKQAEQLLAAQIKRGWNQRLVYLFGDLQAADTTSHQDRAERWLEQHPQDPVLLLTLGKISLRSQLWGKARSYLEASIKQQATPEAYRLLGSLLERLEEAEEASECYRKGIELIDQGMPETALPAAGNIVAQAAVPLSHSA